MAGSNRHASGLFSGPEALSALRYLSLVAQGFAAHLSFFGVLNHFQATWSYSEHLFTQTLCSWGLCCRNKSFCVGLAFMYAIHTARIDSVLVLKQWIFTIWQPCQFYKYSWYRIHGLNWSQARANFSLGWIRGELSVCIAVGKVE